jgi:hypothetical protein
MSTPSVVLPAIITLSLFATLVVWASIPTTLNDFFLPGSQPGQSGNLENPDKCDNCHGGYDLAVEPAFNWRGSMMAQAARDPLFYASVTIANQDAPQSGDLCIRCHSPSGWLEGRSVPTDGSALNNNDREGVQCDFCHKAVKPTPLGVNPYPNDTGYTNGTYPQDQAYLSSLTDIPPTEANGMYIADNDNAKRGPFIDAAATHQMFYSPFHSDADICGTCHDVSNPSFTKDSLGAYVPNAFDQQAPDFDPYSMFPVERTFSEWKMSQYNTPEGVYAPQFGGNKDTVSTCQDCHMWDVTGFGCNKAGAPERSDLPLHDLTGGNTFIPLIIDAAFPGETDAAALDSGIQRAIQMLQLAALLEVTAVPHGSNHLATVQVTNETGHKLPSGYPEGRRIWPNVKAYDSTGVLIYESGAYDTASGILTHDSDIKVYEIKPGISNSLAPVVGLPAGPSFHFVINDTVYEDNRIPPRGFTNANFEMIQSPPVGYSYPDSQYWDDTDYLLPGATAEIVVTLYYQTTSKEYVEFLRDENVTDDWGNILYNLWASNGKSTPVAMNSSTINVTPIPGNNPPVLDPIGDKFVDEGALLEFLVTAADPDGDSIVLTTSILPTGATFADSGNGVGLFSWMPDFTQAGDYPVSFYATDESAATDSELIQITVNNVNRPPEIDPVADTTIDECDTLYLLITAADPDGDSIFITIETLAENMSFTDNGDGTATFTFTPGFDQAGVYLLTVSATDGISIATESFTISVNECFNLIVTPDTLYFTAVEDGTNPDTQSFIVTEIGDGAIAYTVTESSIWFDLDKAGGTTPDPVVVSVDITSLVAGSYFDSVTTASAVAVNSPIYEFVSLVVTPPENNPPVLDSIGPKDVNAGENLNFLVTASDPDGDSIILETDTLFAGMTFTDHGNDTATFDWTPTEADTGTHSVTFIASDNDLSDSDVVAITVTAPASCCVGIRGNVDDDPGDLINVADLTYMIEFLFRGGPPPPCTEEGNVNGDAGELINVADLTYLVDFLFQGGPEPSPCP